MATCFDLRRLREFSWRLVVYTHLVASVFWWWLMPGGFPATHLRFWSNQVFPLSAIAVCLVCLWFDWRRTDSRLINVAAMIPAFWMAATIAGVVLFPVSARRFLLPALFVTGAVLIIFWWRFWTSSWRQVGMMAATLSAVVISTGVVVAQRGPDPDTTPANAPIPEVDGDIRSVLPSIEIGDGQMLPYDGSVRVTLTAAPGQTDSTASQSTERATDRGHRLKLEIQPLLSFESRSPDRCWTILSPRALREGPTRKLVGARPIDEGWEAAYADDGRSVLRVTASADEQGLQIEAFSRLDAPIYSHLNTFSEVLIRGHRALFLSFSPCPDNRFKVESADYPLGRPTRLAYVDAADVFHVVQAASGEKGPFHELARGTLHRSEPLSITLWDEETPVGRIVMADWSAQASRSLSPTAGWGLPMNAIEFRLLSDDAESMAAIWVTLAGTSVGRGWDSVGHSAGVYRNRLRVEPVRQ
ncbi:MAG: hypothetical protein EXS05_23585 [Planctomycetaceae bacterium]|nr:hypothetical protein [Planctomycetaceae bacterium]